MRSEKDMKKITEQNPTPTVIPLLLDVTKEDSIQQAYQQIAGMIEKQQVPPLFCLVNNAGVSIHGPVEIAHLKHVQQGFDVNVMGLFRATQVFLPLLRAAAKVLPHGDARIVNISSLAGLVALPNMGMYCASKHAVNALTTSLRNEVYKFNIRVSAICPGRVKTNFTSNSFATIEKSNTEQSQELKQAYEKYFRQLQGRMEQKVSKPEDLMDTTLLPQDVSQLLYNVMTCRYPECIYTIGQETLKAKLASLLPAFIQDALARSMFPV